jgi:hypothetical protein
MGLIESNPLLKLGLRVDGLLDLLFLSLLPSLDETRYFLEKSEANTEYNEAAEKELDIHFSSLHMA